MFSLTKELAYLIGVYLGDGSVYIYQRKDGKGKNYWFRLSCIDYDFIEETKRCLEKILPNRKFSVYKLKLSGRFKNERQQYQLVSRDKDIAEFLQSVTLNKKQIPPFLFDTTHEIQKSFISGLLDSEGWVQVSLSGQVQVGICNTEIWIDEVIKMVQRLGVKIGKRQVCPPKPNKFIQGKLDKIRYIFNTKSFIESGLYFHIERKQSRLRDYNMAPQLGMKG